MEIELMQYLLTFSSLVNKILTTEEYLFPQNSR